ncbi:longevity assurance proteins LAG1/LAC1 [Apiospora phragmitis]|uniref:Longevity assurance proteins LAG1/LAC1 n=1 Tax=Apiospora phragmitis TaxID=2905665 RepID=A0ABR1VCC8_9PEZI
MDFSNSSDAIQDGLVIKTFRQGRQRKAAKSSKRLHLAKSGHRFIRKHTWALPLMMLIGIAALYAINPTESNIIHHFIFLSYPLPPSSQQEAHHHGHARAPTIQYGKGPWDVAFVAFYTVVLTFTREFVMQEVLRPLSRSRFCGIASRGKQLRFMEQMYTALYFGVMGPFGLYVMRQTPVWYFNTCGMYETYPNRTHEAVFKFYYLFEAAYWAQQALVMLLGLEKRRKDFKELVGHHIVTLSLISLSYRYHFTYAGIAVYITHDISDFFLAVSKSLHYIDSAIVGPFFATNVGVSTLTEFKTVGPYELDWHAEQYKCWISNVIVLVLLSFLQSLNLFWLWCLLRSGFRYVVYNIKKDDRSDAEESADEADEKATGPNGKCRPEPPLIIISAAEEEEETATATGSAKPSGSTRMRG